MIWWWFKIKALDRKCKGRGINKYDQFQHLGAFDHPRRREAAWRHQSSRVNDIAAKDKCGAGRNHARFATVDRMWRIWLYVLFGIFIGSVLYVYGHNWFVLMS